LSTINKTNNHISPQIIEHKRRTLTYVVVNPCFGLGGTIHNIGQNVA